MMTPILRAIVVGAHHKLRRDQQEHIEKVVFFGLKTQRNSSLGTQDLMVSTAEHKYFGVCGEDIAIQ